MRIPTGARARMVCVGKRFADWLPHSNVIFMAANALNSGIAFSTLGRRAAAPTIARLMTSALENPKLLSLAAGFTDNRSLPAKAVRAGVEKLTAIGADPEVLQYGLNQGRLGLRRLLAARLAAQDGGGTVERLASQMMVTNGSQQALYLAIQVLCDPGDIVLVDRPSYFVFLEMLRGLGVRPLSLPTSSDGALDLAALRPWLRRLRATPDGARVKALYFVSYFSNPTGRSMPESEKIGLGEALASEGWHLPVLEDGAYRDLHYTSPCPARSVLTLPAWAAFPCFYLCTLTKSFATGLKVGFGVCTDDEWRERMLHVKGHHDFGTTNFAQAVIEQSMMDGSFERQLTEVRSLYERKMCVLHDTLVAESMTALGWRWAKPSGGLYLWLQAPEHVDTGMDSAFCHACLAEGVLFVPGDLCFGDAPLRNFLRLSFGVLGVDDLQEAGRRLARAARRFAT